MRNSKGFSIGPSTSFAVSALFLKVLGAMPRSSKPSEMSYLILSHQECPFRLWTAKRNHGCAQTTTVACLSLRLIFIAYTHILGVLLYVLFSEGFSHVHLHWRWHYPLSLIAITNGPFFVLHIPGSKPCLSLYTLEPISHFGHHAHTSMCGDAHSWYHWLYSFLSAFGGGSRERHILPVLLLKFASLHIPSSGGPLF